MDDEKNPAAVKLGKLAAKKRGRDSLVEAGRRGGLRKAANRQSSADQLNHERDLERQERKK